MIGHALGLIRSVVGCFPIVVAVHSARVCESQTIGIVTVIPFKIFSNLICWFAAQVVKKAHPQRSSSVRVSQFSIPMKEERIALLGEVTMCLVGMS